MRLALLLLLFLSVVTAQIRKDRHDRISADGVQSSCLFICDYYYLGSASTTNYGIYISEKNFIEKVDAAIYKNGSYLANGDCFGYTYEDFAERLAMAVDPMDPNDFSSAMDAIMPAYELNYASLTDVVNQINNFAWETPISVDSCLVLFSGTSFGGKGLPKITNPAFNRVIGVSINGADLSGLSDVLIPVSISGDYSNSDDLAAVVDAILHAPPPPPPTTTTVTTTVTVPTTTVVTTVTVPATTTVPITTTTVAPTSITKPTTTRPKPTGPPACLFVGDYYYLGPLNAFNMGTYKMESAFVSNVDAIIYKNGTYFANAVFYGYEEDDFNNQMDAASKLLDANDFSSRVTKTWPSDTLNYASIADAISRINAFTWDVTEQPLTTLVFFSGNPYSTAIPKIANSLFDRIIGVSLNGADVSAYADNVQTVSISNDFTAADVLTLAKAILST